MSSIHKCQKTSVYQPPQKNKLQVQRQPPLVIDDKSFPTLLNELKKTIETKDEDNSLDKDKTNMIYKDKLTFIETDNNSDKKEDDLPDGWVRFKLDRKQKTILKTVKEETYNNTKEEKMDFDSEYLINFFKKRRENYINVYGEDNYRKVFGSLNYYGYYSNDYTEEIESNHYSDNEISSREDEII